MEEALKNLFVGVKYEDMIVECDRRTYHPYSANAYDNSDEINLVIQKADLITVTYDSVIYLEGTLNPTTPNKTYDFTNNAPLFLFDEIRFILGDQVIEIVRLPGINSTIKGFCSYTTNQSRCLSHAGWSPADSPQILNSTKTAFCASIPLKHVLGFAEGYKKPLVNIRQELILIRSKDDRDCYKGETEVKINLTKVTWKVPYVIPNDAMKLSIYGRINKNSPIQVAFHACDLYVYPTLPTSRSLVWSVKSSTGFQRPQWLLIAFQTKKRNNKEADASRFNHLSVSNIKANINNRRYPYEQQNLVFTDNKYVDAYEEYLNFRNQYYDALQEGSLLSY
ncbi:uncharacterized protein LOC116167085 [Photinus pyralis]|uniref:uncharacterized protein LOC116165625 n=1 Tax=Photinus pyralis TaxID=7054 RepID=UPI0012673594|nr:uncharacterized protein LOC116165625 [Photinus pyralis]XP_031338184.1 uncharacterized protein LOC116167085 [Photinus pyralis]